MNPLKKGPELKMPSLKKPDMKVPGPVADFYYDLRDRRLLPVLALVVVAIAAMPFLLGGGDEPSPPAATGGSAGAEAGRTSALTVVEATPGLRDYRKRLEGRSPSDPFTQQFTNPPPGSGASGGEGGSSSSSSSSGSSSGEGSFTTESTTVEVEAGGGGSGGGSGGNDSAQQPSSGARLFEFVLDVQISHEEPTDGGTKMSEPQVRRGVKTLAQLPGEKRPVVTVGGVNLHNGKVYFLVADEVRSLDGEFDCVTRAPGGLCELLELEPGFPLELAYGPDRIAYRIKVIEVDTAWSGRPGDERSSRSSPRSERRIGGAALGAQPRP